MRALGCFLAGMIMLSLISHAAVPRLGLVGGFVLALFMAWQTERLLLWLTAPAMDSEQADSSATP